MTAPPAPTRAATTVATASTSSAVRRRDSPAVGVGAGAAGVPEAARRAEALRRTTARWAARDAPSGRHRRTVVRPPTPAGSTPAAARPGPAVRRRRCPPPAEGCRRESRDPRSRRRWSSCRDRSRSMRRTAGPHGRWESHRAPTSAARRSVASASVIDGTSDTTRQATAGPAYGVPRSSARMAVTVSGSWRGAPGPDVLGSPAPGRGDAAIAQRRWSRAEGRVTSTSSTRPTTPNTAASHSWIETILKTVKTTAHTPNQTMPA